MAQWTFLTNHAHVLLCVAQNPNVRLREVANLVGITERAAQRKQLGRLHTAGSGHHVARAGLGRPDRQHPRAGRRFEHKLVGDQSASPGSKPGKARRRCKLLPLDLLFAPIGLGRNSGIK